MNVRCIGLSSTQQKKREIVLWGNKGVEFLTFRERIRLF